jgi:low temperature requirement protein LtrA
VLFFDLVYAFAISQLTRCLLLDFTVGGVVRTTILLLAAWAVWVLSTWVVTYFDADQLPVRFMLVGVMTMNMLMFASLPHSEAKWAFGVALPMVAILFAWPSFLLSQGVGRDELRLRFLRALAWAPVFAIPWIAGAMASPRAQVAWWGGAVILIYVIAWMGFPVPRLGRSQQEDWAITGAHLSTRCGQLVVIGFGEPYLALSGRLGVRPPTPAELMVWMVAFLAGVSLWWTYHETCMEVRRAPAHRDTNDLWRSAYTYIHIPLVMGIIAIGAAIDVIMGDPTLRPTADWSALILGAPALFLASNALFFWVFSRRVPLAQLIAVVALVALAPLAKVSSMLVLAAVATSVVIALALWVTVNGRRLRRAGFVADSTP